MPSTNQTSQASSGALSTGTAGTTSLDEQRMQEWRQRVEYWDLKRVADQQYVARRVAQYEAEDRAQLLAALDEEIENAAKSGSRFAESCERSTRGE